METERRVSLVPCDGAGALLGKLPAFTVDDPWWQQVEAVVTAGRERFTAFEHRNLHMRSCRGYTSSSMVGSIDTLVRPRAMSSSDECGPQEAQGSHQKKRHERWEAPPRIDDLRVTRGARRCAGPEVAAIEPGATKEADDGRCQ
jgi:hypothetical protein